MFHNQHNESPIVNGNSKAIQSAVVAAEPASEAEVPGAPKPTFDLYANHLSCPQCGGECLHPDDYARVIGLLVVVRDELELAGRSPGDLVTITRQANDSCINDLAIVARLIRKMAER